MEQVQHMNNDNGNGNIHLDLNDDGIDETEFRTVKEDSEKLFTRQAPYQAPRRPFAFQDLLDTLNAKKISKTDSLGEVELDPTTNRLHLKTDRSNLRARYGYDIGKEVFLYPEEALYLLDLGKIEIFCNHLSLSVQRARSRLLVCDRPVNCDKLANCTSYEYLVYQDLSHKGYCLYRYRPELDETDSMNSSANQSSSSFNSSSMVEEVEMEDRDVILEGSEMEDIIEVEPSGGSANMQLKGIKRKRGLTSDDEMSDDSDELMMGDYDGPDGNASYFVNTVGGEFNDPEVEPGGYTVDEADSDVEIVDEVIFSHGGVEIQEISHSAGCIEDMVEENEPVPSTSKGPPPPAQVVVDLVSSDEDEEDLRMYGNKIWSKFVPNSKLYVKIPPSSLIPETIPASDTVYEYDLKDKSDVSDLELEFLVDEVSLNDDTSGREPSAYSTRSWKEWRQQIFQEARDVMNDSLLASSDFINGASAEEKLLLWEDNQSEAKKPVPFLNNVVFEVYGPLKSNFSRSRIEKTGEKPRFYVSILRDDDTIPDLKSFASSIDGVPIVNAILCDGGDIVYIEGDNSPLNSLF